MLIGPKGKAMKSSKPCKATGFSLLELLVAMTLTLIVAGMASTVLTSSLRTRNQENRRSEALAATQRALNIMSREIANEGFGLKDSGIVAADSGPTSIRILSNVVNTNSVIGDADEDVRYVYQPANKAIVRYDRFPAPAGTTTVLATNISDLTITYKDSANNPIASPANYINAVAVTLRVSVDLPAASGQPATTVRLMSDVTLRNAPAAVTLY